MTSLTTILGLVPMLVPFGDGYAFRQSLALSLMGGMVSSTILTLYLIPIIFRWVERRFGKSESVAAEAGQRWFGRDFPYSNACGPGVDSIQPEPARRATAIRLCN